MLPSASYLVAGSLAAAAYLNAKYHIAKDLGAIYAASRGARSFEEAKSEKKISILRTLQDHARNIPNEDCIWTRERTYTWAETLAMVVRYANWFLELGVERDECVAFYLQNSAEFMFAWMGLLVMNAYPAMVNFNLEGGGLVHCVRISKARIILIDDELARRVLENDNLKSLGLQMLVLNDDLKTQIEGRAARDLPESVTHGSNEMSAVALRYTSGTTGYPKAVMGRLGRSYQFAIGGKFRDLGIRPQPNGDRWYVAMPICHATAGSTSMASIVAGATLCIAKRFSVTTFWDDIRASDATLFVYVGEICRYLLAAQPSPRDKDHRIRLIYGNGLRPDVWIPFRDRFGIATIVEMFGATEGVIGFTNMAHGDFLAGAIAHHGALMRWRTRQLYIPVGVDYESSEVLRDQKAGLAVRQSWASGGEILVAVPSTAAFPGYFENAAATQKKFLKNAFKDGDLYYRTGDALKRDDDGRWYFVDRLGDTFRWRGENVSTAEVSEVLGKFPGVIDANVVGVSVPGHEGRAGCAALLLHDDRVDLQELLRHARRDLPRYAVPVFLRIVKEPAMNNTHKQSKTKLRDDGIDPAKTGEDRMFILLGEEYVPFEQSQWKSLSENRLRL